MNASIPAVPMKDVYRLPEAALVNDAYIWVLDEKSELVRVSAQRIYSHEGYVYVRVSTQDIPPLLRVVSRPLSNFRAGMTVSDSNTKEMKKSES